jgi:hypothetical protein
MDVGGAKRCCFNATTVPLASLTALVAVFLTAISTGFAMSYDNRTNKFRAISRAGAGDSHCYTCRKSLNQAAAHPQWEVVEAVNFRFRPGLRF